ncbi:MAG: amidohydrolase [Bacillota bacterium]
MLAISGGYVITMAGPPLEAGTVLVEGTKIAAVGRDLVPPSGAEVFDARGKFVLPGLIDAHCHVGIIEEVFRREGDDANETTDPVTPHLRAIDGIDPCDLGFADALAGGVTTLCVTPGSANVIGGEMAVLKAAGGTVEAKLVRFPAGMKAALGENPKRVYGQEKRTPATRMANAALLRTALVQAQEYLRKRERREGKEAPDRDLKWEALGRVLEGKIPLRVHAHRADDILTAVRVAREFGAQLVIEHGTEAYKVADVLAREGVPVVLGPIITNRPKPEMRAVDLRAAKRLADAGVRFAVMTDHPVVPVQYLGLSAALTVRGGLDEERALASVTIEAARILGVADRLGSLEPGKDADIVVMDRPLFDARSRVKAVFVDGRPAYRREK